MSLNRPTPRHIIIKMAKVKERILKAPREKQRVIYKGTLVRLSADFSVASTNLRGLKLYPVSFPTTMV